MTVRDLIDKLSEVDEELDVYFWDGNDSFEIDKFATDEDGDVDEVILYNEELRIKAFDDA